MTSFEEFANVCSKIEKISGSIEITSIVSEFLKKINDEELEIIPHFIMGHIFPTWSEKELGIGQSLLYSSISKTSSIPVKQIERLVKETGDVGRAAEKAISSGKTHANYFFSEELSITDVYSRFKVISNLSGKGSQDTKIKNLQYLFSTAKSVEIIYIARLAIEELRIGVGEGIVRNAISRAFNVPIDLVENGYMLTNDFGIVALKAKKEGRKGLENLDVMVGRPLKVMLAQVSEGIQRTIDDVKRVPPGAIAVEWKFDGARVQIHKDDNDVTIYSRRLENITSSLPDIARFVKSNILAKSAILDGEAIALNTKGRPIAFQEVLKRFRRKYDVEITATDIPLYLNLFDILYLNGESLINSPLTHRRRKLEEICDKTIITKQTITNDPTVIETIYKEALSAGHEGIMMKNPSSLYIPGKRGKNWLKLKPIMETLDLIVIGGEWGEGRRANLIGSYLLACKDPGSDRFLPVGRVATGITDQQLEDLTKVFKELIISESGIHVDFEPKIIFEVAFEEIQKSPNYNSGYALRFPRLIGVRSDKSSEDTDTMEKLEQLYAGQKGRR